MDTNTSQKKKEKKPIQILRERRGGIPKDLVARNRDRTKAHKKVAEALKIGPKTVPEIAKVVDDMPTHEIFWHIVGMKKFGEVVEGEERDGYYEYALKEEEEEKRSEHSG